MKLAATIIIACLLVFNALGGLYFVVDSIRDIRDGGFGLLVISLTIEFLCLSGLYVMYKFPIL